MEEITEQFLTMLEVAALLRISRRKAYMLVENGDLPSFRVGRSYRIPRDVLDQWVADRVAGTA